MPGSDDNATTTGHFVSDRQETFWHVSDDMELRPRCGADIDGSSRVPVIDLAAFSACYRVCTVCAPEAGTPSSSDEENTVNATADRTERVPPEPAGMYVQAEFAFVLEGGEMEG